MNRRLKLWLGIVILSALYFGACQVAPGQDVTPPSWAVEFAGNGDVFTTTLYRQVAERWRIGPEFGYYDGLREGQHQAYEVQVVADYFAVDKVPLNLVVATVPASAYAGVGLGINYSKRDAPVGGNQFDDVAALRLGTEVIVRPVKIGFRYEAEVTDLMWEGFKADKNLTHVFLVTLGYEF